MPTPSARIGIASLLLAAAMSARGVGDLSPEVIGRQAPSAPIVAHHRCGWRPPPTRTEETVASVGELHAAVRRAQPDTTILVRPGTYRLNETIELAAPNMVLRGADGDRSKVIIRGDGMTDHRVGVAIALAAPNITVADLTVGWVGYHGVQVRGERGASGAILHNLRVVDTGQQLVKGSLAQRNPFHADSGLLGCSLLEYTDHAPSDYTNGIDVIGAEGWVVRDNEFRRIRGPQAAGWRAGPAILFWGNSIGTTVERNVVVDSYRGIAFGIGPGGTTYRRDGHTRFDHQGGVIRNNVVINLSAWADEGIEVNDARDVRIEHNTVLVEGQLRRSISVRFPSTSAWVRNNLTNRAIALRDWGHADLAGNVRGARRHWFLDPQDANLRLVRQALPTVRAAVPLPDLTEDFDGIPRSSDRLHDAGAFEYREKPRNVPQ